MGEGHQMKMRLMIWCSCFMISPLDSCVHWICWRIFENGCCLIYCEWLVDFYDSAHRQCIVRCEVRPPTNERLVSHDASVEKQIISIENRHRKPFWLIEFRRISKKTRRRISLKTYWILRDVPSFASGSVVIFLLLCTNLFSAPALKHSYPNYHSVGSYFCKTMELATSVQFLYKGLFWRACS